MSLTVFVYGTLKQGFVNHHFLEDCQFLGEDITKNRFVVKDVGYPIAYPSDIGYPVKGEVYIITPDVLKRIDRLEGYPRFYTRDYVELESGIKAYMYYGNPDGKDLQRIKDSMNIKNGLYEFIFLQAERSLP